MSGTVVSVDTFAAYMVEMFREKDRHPAWRIGQTAFNLLCRHRPDLSERVRTTQINPFYRDQRMTAFLMWVEENW